MVSPLRTASCFFGLLSGAALLCFAQTPAPKPASPTPAKPAETKSGDPKTAAKETGPLTLRDVLLMRQRQLPDDVLGKALERGIDFEVTKPIYNQLAKLGFTPAQLENLQTAHGIEPLPPIVAGSQLPDDEPYRDDLYKQYEEITKATVKDAVPVQTAHLTLWAPQTLHNTILPELKKLDQVLETKFQEPLRSGLDKRSSHIVLVRTLAEASQWVGKYYDVMKVEDPGGKAEFVKRYNDGIMLYNACVLCLEGFDPAKIKNQLALFVGYMSLLQATNFTTVDPLVTGFANGIESVLTGQPSSLIMSRAYGAEERKLGQIDGRWSSVVKRRMQGGKLTPPSQVLKRSMKNMTLAEYAESWSLVDMLVRDRVKFAKLVYELRKEKDGIKAIETVYGWNEDQLMAQWKMYITAY